MSTLKVNTINAATSGQAVAVDVQNPRSNRNLIINGAMELDQRNGGSSITPTSDNTYTLDRFKARLNVASKYSVQKVSEAPSGFNSSLKVTSAAATTVSANHHYQINYAIEGYDSNKLDLGLSTAKKFTLSFWVKSSLTGTFGGAYSNNNGNRFYAWTYTISSANTWEKKSITITGATDGTWEKTNNGGLFIYWTLGAGTDLQTSAGSWGTTFKRGPSGATNIVETSGATWQITGVQLEVGDVATDFEHRSYGDELARCQRYYEQMSSNGVSVAYFTTGYNESTTEANYPILFKTYKRSTPTVTSTAAGTFRAHNTGTSVDLSSLTFNLATPMGCRAQSVSSSGVLTDGGASCLAAHSSTEAIIKIDAEL